MVTLPNSPCRLRLLAFVPPSFTLLRYNQIIDLLITDFLIRLISPSEQHLPPPSGMRVRANEKPWQKKQPDLAGSSALTRYCWILYEFIDENVSFSFPQHGVVRCGSKRSVQLFVAGRAPPCGGLLL